MSIRVVRLVKRYGAHAAVDGVSFEVEDGAFVTLLGPSGSGKSTILRAIAGLETIDEGRVVIDGQEQTRASVQERGVGFVFQHYALFRHMTVIENVSFGLRVRGLGKAERTARANDLLDLVGLSDYGERLPSQLSGGQRQRVALARALAPEPRLLLLDEPFAALDAQLRKELRLWLRRLHDRIRLTTLLVTHDQEEAFDLSDRVVVLHKGRVEQEAPPEVLFDRPASEFVAGFIGETNQIEAVAEGGRARWGPLDFLASAIPDRTPVRIHFRPHEVFVSSRPEAGGAEGIVLESRFLGALAGLRIDLGQGRSIVAQIPKGVAARGRFTPGARVFVNVTAAHVFPV